MTPYHSAISTSESYFRRILYYNSRVSRCYKTNRVRPEQHEFVNGRISAFDRIFGDQLEAVTYLLQRTDERGGFTDGDRDRDIIQQLRRKKRIQMNSSKVAIIGLGYVGLPLAVHFAERGHTVLGLDKDIRKIDSIIKGESYIPDVSSKELQSLLTKKINSKHTGSRHC